MGRARPGADRADVEYVWPQRLLRPSADVPLVYIDLNHWIGLTKAATGHRDGKRHLPALQALRAAAQERGPG